MFTRRHFEAIAAVIRKRAEASRAWEAEAMGDKRAEDAARHRNRRYELAILANDLAETFKAANGAFKIKQFAEACGFTEKFQNESPFE